MSDADWSHLGAARTLHDRTALQRAYHCCAPWAPGLLFFSVWVLGLYACGGEVGVIYICVTALLYFFCNTAKRRTSALSAYSIFNPNFERSAGTLTSADWERQYRGFSTEAPEADTLVTGGPRSLMEGEGQKLGGGDGSGGKNSLLAQLAAERRAREAAAKSK
jgi:hypothetical protein